MHGLENDHFSSMPTPLDKYVQYVTRNSEKMGECVTVVVWSGTRDSGTSLSQSWLAFGRSSMSMDRDTDSSGICGRGIWLVG